VKLDFETVSHFIYSSTHAEYEAQGHLLRWCCCQRSLVGGCNILDLF